MSMASKVVVTAGFLLFVAYVVYSSLTISRFRCEVCMEFRGQTACRSAIGATEEEARRAAIDNACAQLVSGVTDTIACSQTPPSSVSCEEPQ